jgi:mono/diheme cytochrome c family protein
MKTIKLGLVSAALALFIIACNQTQTVNTNSPGNTAIVANANAANTQLSTPTDELASARKIYSEKCVKCHKEDGTGGITQLEDRKIKAPDFTSDRKKKDKDEDWIKTINEGAPEDGMPAFKGKLSDDDIKNLVKLIRKDFQGK